MEPILEAKSLNLWYGPNHALHDVSVAIPERQITAFIGPSGCGKSTFLRTLNRMNDLIPSVKIQGQVDFHGKNIYDAGVDPTRFYTTRTLAQAFLAACDKDRMESFAPLFTGSSTAGQAALAALLPNTFLQALVWRTLTASALPEVTEDEGL